MPAGSERLYLDDILEAIRRIELYTASMSFEDFTHNLLVQDGVCRNLANLGEAVKKLPEEVTGRRPEIDWPKIAGLRDILVHEYAGVDLAIVWDVVGTKLAPLKEAVRGLREASDQG